MRSSPPPIDGSSSDWSAYLLERAPAMIAYVDTTMRYRYASPAYLAWMNMADRDIVGQRVDGVMGSDLYAQIEPALSADLEAESVYLRTSEARLRVPIAAFGGRADPFTAPEDVASWAAHTAEWCSVTLCEGGHFFLADGLAVLRARLATVLDQARSVRAGSVC